MVWLLYPRLGVAYKAFGGIQLTINLPVPPPLYPGKEKYAQEAQQVGFLLLHRYEVAELGCMDPSVADSCT